MTPNVGTQLHVLTEAESRLSAAALETLDARIGVDKEIDSGALKQVLSGHDLFVRYVKPGLFTTDRTSLLRPYFANIQPSTGTRTFILETPGWFTIVQDSATPSGTAGNWGIHAALTARGVRPNGLFA